MNREDEICLALQGLINGIDYDTGEVVEFSDKVKDSLKVIATTFNCRERCQQISDISESEQSEVSDWDIVNGTFKEIIQTIKRDRPNHLVIIQNGYYYEVLNEDAVFFVDRFSYNTFDWHGTTKTGFPINSKKVLSDLREMKKPFVVVSQLPKGEHQKVRRAISDVYDGDDNLSDVRAFSNNPIRRDVSSPFFGKRKTVQPIEKRGNHAGNFGNKSTSSSGAKKATHVPKPENKYPKQYIDEPLGTREDSKKMYGRQGAINRSNKN
jgi:hypothetical protein